MQFDSVSHKQHIFTLLISNVLMLFLHFDMSQPYFRHVYCHRKVFLTTEVSSVVFLTVFLPSILFLI